MTRAKSRGRPKKAASLTSTQLKKMKDYAYSTDEQLRLKQEGGNTSQTSTPQKQEEVKRVGRKVEEIDPNVRVQAANAVNYTE